MKVVIGGDHRGYPLKEMLKEYLQNIGHEVVDVGTDSEESVDYPEYAGKVAEIVSKGDVNKGILICGSGIGVCIAANKYKKVRAANVINAVQAKMARSHNDANVMCIGADFVDFAEAKKMVDGYIQTDFESGRHARRIEQISAIESTN
jgi:ribose 5-phosphate isomerase B